MIIQKTNEGERLSYGINWRINENTFFLIYLVLPIWLVLPDKYEDFCTMDIFHGWRIKKLYLRLRIRRKKKFPKGVRMILFNANTELWPFGKQTLISIYEQRLNNNG